MADHHRRWLASSVLLAAPLSPWLGFALNRSRGTSSVRDRADIKRDIEELRKIADELRERLDAIERGRE